MSQGKGLNVSDSSFLLSKEEKIRRGILSDDQIVNSIDHILYRAVDVSASDVHFQPCESGLRVRYRIDGVLHDQDLIDTTLMVQSVSRLKVLSSMDISEKRVPQDGKFRMTFVQDFYGENVQQQKKIDFRASTFPSIYGEKLVVRILDRDCNVLKLGSLGLEKSTLEDVRRLMYSPYGFFLVTGPTGSGKTTTLYAVLSSLETNEKNIVTMEDPVEYNLAGITQSQVNLKSGFSFENGLRSILRQDPDVIMIGEIRDKPTIQIAIESALTGHLVFSTLHTNSAAGVIVRLLDMGVEPFLINASLTGVLAQRLVRRLCDNCKKPSDLTSSEKSKLSGVTGSGVACLGVACFEKVFRPVGCKECFGVGYKGRIGFFELLVLNDEIRSKIVQRPNTHEIQSCAEKMDMTSLRCDGIEKVKQGLTSLDEFFLVAGYEGSEN